MSREFEFLIYCIEIFKVENHLTGKETMEIFEKYNVSDYVIDYFESLHTTGEKYILNDIDLYIKSQNHTFL